MEGEVKSVNPNGGTDDRGNALPLISIVQTGGFRVKGYVNESNASVLNEGAKVVIRARTGNQTWSGAITSIDWNNPAQSGGSNYYDGGSSDTGTSSKYPFYVELDSSDGLLLGQHVYIEPDLGQSDSPAGIQLPQRDAGRIQRRAGYLRRDGRPDGLGLYRLPRRHAEGRYDLRHL